MVEAVGVESIVVDSHRSGAHESHHCITTGRMNARLDATHLFRSAEFALATLGARRTK
ncbi:MAG: hypothetical protein ABIQ16_21825 [Polyangiaceae bacterium]